MARKKKGSKKRPPKKHVDKAPAGTKEESKDEPAEATGEAKTVISDEEISDKPAEESNKGFTETLSETSTAPPSTKTSEREPQTRSGETRAMTKEPTPEPVDIVSEDDVPLASLKRKRAIEDKETEPTDSPIPKSPKLDGESSLSPFREIRELRTLGELASEGWDTQDLCRKICCVDTVGLSRIPSPFAHLADHADRFTHIIGHHVHPQVSFLFENLQCGRTAKLTTFLDKRQPGAFGAFQCDGIGPQFFPVPHDPPKHLLDLNRGNGRNGGTNLDVRVRKNARTGEIGYFVVNEQRNLFINEKLVARNSVAGPLPEFAVIQVGYWVVFWWCTRAALGYIPESVSQGVKEIEDEDATNEPSRSENEDATNESSNSEDEDASKEPSPSYSGARKGFHAALASMLPLENGSEEGEIAESTRLPTQQLTSWEELDYRLRRHNRQRIEASDRPECHRIVSPSGMNIDDVLLAVATFWEPLRNQGTDFVIAGADVIGAVGQLNGFGVIGTSNVFIMPLIFPVDPEEVEQDDKRKLEKVADGFTAKEEAKKDEDMTDGDDSSSSIGHLLLAIATEAIAPPHNVNINILDSRANTVDSGVIRRKATEVASVWLERDVQAEFCFKSVPQQTGQSNTGGLYVILNAWASMLNIGPIKDASCGADAKFMEHGLKIVNLALAGFLDSKTVRAFLSFHGYIEGDLDLREGQDDEENVVKAATMDHERFRSAMDRAANPPSASASVDSLDRELVQSPSPVSLHRCDTSGVQGAVPDFKIQQFLRQAQQATFEQAEIFLKDAGGDVDEAIVLFVVQQSQLGGPDEGAKPME